jgi:hypothetical protein
MHLHERSPAGAAVVLDECTAEGPTFGSRALCLQEVSTVTLLSS